MTKITLSIFALLISLSANANNRYTWLCGGRHEFHPLQYKTEFYVTVDLDTIRTENDKSYVESYLETTDRSKTPENGFAELKELELIRYEKLGDTTHLDVQGQDLAVNESMLTFFTLGLDIPDDGRSIIFSSYVDGVPMDGNCKRRSDMDELWAEEVQE